MRRPALLAVICLTLLAACHPQTKSEQPPPISTGSGSPGTGSTTSVPPVPTTSASPLGTTEPPTVWVGGTLTDVTEREVTVTESLGSVLTLHRLARGATGFFEVSGSEWQRLPEGASIPTGGPACVETLMAGSNLLALRVFLGAPCGPA